MTIAEQILRAKTDYDKVYAKGIEVGKSQSGGSYDEGFKAGSKTEYDKFWDALQLNGERTIYYHGFHGYTREGFEPKYDIIPTNAYRMFFNTEKFDLQERLDECGVKLDFSKCTNFSQFLLWSKITRIGVIDTSSAGRNHTVDFSYATELKTVDGIVLGENPVLLNFTSCGNLANVLKIEGEIQHNVTLNSSAKLSLASAKNFINALKDFSGTDYEYDYSIAFSSETLAALEADGATAPGGNTWTAYARSKGWNI